MGPWSEVGALVSYSATAYMMRRQLVCLGDCSVWVYGCIATWYRGGERSAPSSLSQALGLPASSSSIPSTWDQFCGFQRRRHLPASPIYLIATTHLSPHTPRLTSILPLHVVNTVTHCTMQPSPLLAHLFHYAQAFQSYLGLSSDSSPTLTLTPVDEPVFPTFALSEQWQLLGPFQIGTREAIWGADPLEQYGGFRNLTYDDHARYPSSLPFNATVSWSNITAKLNDPYAHRAAADISVDYPSIDWRLLQEVYGWAALQWQGWARGEIIVQREDSAVVSLRLSNVLEYWIDDVQYFGGDFYGFHRAPTILSLEPGIHKIDIRLVRDVRAMGGITDNPSIDVKIEMSDFIGDLLVHGDIVIADRLGDEAGLLASETASVVLQNAIHEEIWIDKIEPRPDLRNFCKTLFLQGPVKISPGASRPVAFGLKCTGISNVRSVGVEISYYSDSTKVQNSLVFNSWTLGHVKDKYQPHKITYLHPGGMASYAILRPPSPEALKNCNSTNNKLPVLLSLHGAGLEADSEAVRHALDPLADLCAWVLFATGVTPWSGDDWHNWGFADVEAAVNAIPTWINHTSWSGPGVDLDSWLMVGHSNGGQGVWYGLLHRPDKIIAAAPLSGYSSIQNYVPYELWRPADPRKVAIVQSGLNRYRHELLLANAKDIPILQQHGSEDDNVPAYHSRLMHQLLSQNDAGSKYHEMKGKPHYWDGVFTTPHLYDFYERHLNQSPSMKPLLNFTVVSANPADTGPKNGLEILLLMTPGQLGSVQVMLAGHRSSCALHTNNVRQLRIPASTSHCDTLSIDSTTMEPVNGSESIVVKRHADGRWAVSKEDEATSTTMRHRRQLGPIDSILRTRGAIQIVTRTHNEEAKAVKHTALQISKNLCQYFSADTEITANASQAIDDRMGSVISISLGADVSQQSIHSKGAHHAITIHPDRISVRDAQGAVHDYRDRGRGLAAIYLRPLPDERLELMLWGVDEASLRIVSRLVPTLTGAGVPDFVIAESSMLWKGIEGTLAMGFFDEHWNVSMNAFFS
jgi:predicted esterase